MRISRWVSAPAIPALPDGALGLGCTRGAFQKDLNGKAEVLRFAIVKYAAILPTVPRFALRAVRTGGTFFQMTVADGHSQGWEDELNHEYGPDNAGRGHCGCARSVEVVQFRASYGQASPHNRMRLVLFTDGVEFQPWVVLTRSYMTGAYVCSRFGAMSTYCCFDASCKDFVGELSGTLSSKIEYLF